VDKCIHHLLRQEWHAQHRGHEIFYEPTPRCCHAAALAP
jgi:hypothetical protein